MLAHLKITCVHDVILMMTIKVEAVFNQDDDDYDDNDDNDDEHDNDDEESNNGQVCRCIG